MHRAFALESRDCDPNSPPLNEKNVFHSAFAPSNPGVACRSTSQVCLRQVAARKAAPITSVTMAGESPRLNNFKKLLSTAALSALLMLPVAAPAKEQLGGTFKILQGASSTQVTGDARRP